MVHQQLYLYLFDLNSFRDLTNTEKDIHSYAIIHNIKAFERKIETVTLERALILRT